MTKPRPKYKHLTAFSRMVTPTQTNLKAFILCGRRLAMGVDYTNDPDGDHNCPDCRRSFDVGTQSGRLTRSPNPLLRGKQILDFN